MVEDLRRRLYRDVLFIRLVEERIASLYAEQEMRCPVHLSIGQEAVAVGVCTALSPEDWVLSGHRSHGHYLARGGSLKAMLGELYGRVTGCCEGKGGSMHLVDLDCGFLGAVPIVGSTLPVAVGAAFGASMRGERRVTVAFFGEGATEEGVFHEAVNFAVLKKLPIVFVCENNFFSVYSPLSVRQPEGRSIRRLAEGYGLPAIADDGNRVEHVHALATEAVERARSGGGPSFLELETYRWLEHCGPNHDDHLGYRDPAEVDRWLARCPLRLAEEALLADKLMTREQVQTLREQLESEIDAAFASARAAPFPDRNHLFAHIVPE